MLAKSLITLEPTDVFENVRVMMKAKGLQKEVGSSLIQLGGIKSIESAKDGMPHQRSMIYSVSSEIGSQIKVFCRDSRAV
ncbi:hypothetical protein NL676_009189 [Syzygium grande]|nr:hypothetical protein NL676_009189 [Syzygium grande]